MTALVDLPLRDGTTFSVPAEHAERLAAEADWWPAYHPRSGGGTNLQIIGSTPDGRLVKPAPLLLEWSGQPRPSELHTGDHRDRNQRNNALENLRWATRPEQNANRELPPSRVILDASAWASIAERRPCTSDSALAREYGIARTTIIMRLGARRDTVVSR